MGRDVPYSGGGILRPPVLVETPNVEVADLVQVATGNARRGRYSLGLALNGCYAQRVGALVNDYDPRAILDNDTSFVARWRPKNTFGRGSLSGRTANVYLYLTAVDAGDTAPALAQVDVSCSAGSVSWNYSADIATVTRVLVGTIPWDDSLVYDEATAEITSLGLDDLVAVKVYGVCVVPVRTVTKLPTGEYSNDVIPLDLSAYAGERGVSTARLRDEHAMAIDAYVRTGNVYQAARPQNAFKSFAFEATPPRDVTELEVHVRTHTAAAGVGRLTVSNEQDSNEIGTATNTWFTYTLPVTPGLPTRVECLETTPGTAQLVSACAYWADAGRPRSS